MKVALDLFSGTGSATKAFAESDDWRVVRVEKADELVEKYGAEIHADILNLQPSDFPEEVDFVWASPPCTSFSIASVGHHWNGFPMPKTVDAVKGVQLVFKTLYLIENLNPDYWFLENPMGQLRNVIGRPSGQVTYCQYGDYRMKPTDLWGVHPSSFDYRRCSNGSGCHESAPRGSDHSGTQSSDMDSVERARVPFGLSKSILQAVENPGKTDRQQSLMEVRDS